MKKRRDRKNVARLLAHGKDHVGHGWSLVKMVWHEGWLAKYHVEEFHPGAQEPLEKEEDDGE